MFERLIRFGVLQGIETVYIAVSHLHSDHSGSLGSAVLYCFQKMGKKARLILPEDDPVYAGQLRTLLSCFGVPPQAYDTIADGPLQGFSCVKGFRYVPTVHAPNLRCFSFEMDTSLGGIFYSADTCRTDEMTDFIRRHDRICAICMDTTDQDAPGGVHLPMTELRGCLPEELLPRTFLMHLSGDACLKKAGQLGLSVVSVQDRPE